MLALLVGPLLAAAGPKENVLNASKKLADKGNYTWEVTFTNLNGNGFRFGPNEGKTEKGGYTWYSMTMNDNTTDNGWQTRAEATEGSDEPGPAMFLARMLDDFQTPPKQAEDLVSKTKEIKKSGDAYVGDLTENGAKELLSFRRGGNDDNGPTVSKPKGSVKFWIKHGLLTRYEYNLQGTVSFNGNDFDVNRTTAVEIKDIGSTKIAVPDEAMKKLSS